MSESSFRHTLRRRIAPVALLLAVGLLASRTCANETRPVEIRLALGAAAAQLDTLRVDVFPAGASTGVASFERHLRRQPASGPLGFQAALDPGTYSLRIEARGASDRTLERAIVVDEQLGDRAVISVDLEQALLPPAAD